MHITDPKNQLLRERLQPYIDEATAPATRKAYRVDLRHFQEWGGRMPASPQMVADYLVSLAQTHKPATLNRRLAAISRAHNTLGLPNPVGDELVRLTMRGIRRKHGVRQKQARALLKDDVAHIIGTLGDSPRDIRDKALLLVGFCGAFRRSELVALDVEDLQMVQQGVILTIQHSKTDQEGRGRKIGIPRGRFSQLCAVQALALWLEVAGITTGPVFRPISKGRAIACTRLSSGAVSRLIKERALDAELDAVELSGHSLRAGLATSAAQAGVSSHKIRAQTGHASDTMLSRYIRDGDLFLGNAAGIL
jgi:integrase